MTADGKIGFVFFHNRQKRRLLFHAFLQPGIILLNLWSLELG